MCLTSTSSLRPCGRLHWYRRSSIGKRAMYIRWLLHGSFPTSLAQWRYERLMKCRCMLWSELCRMSPTYFLIIIDSLFVTKSFTAEFTSLTIQSPSLEGWLFVGWFSTLTLGSSLTADATWPDHGLLSLFNTASHVEISTLSFDSVITLEIWVVRGEYCVFGSLHCQSNVKMQTSGSIHVVYHWRYSGRQFLILISLSE